MGAPGPTANVASWLQYFGTSFWPLRHHNSLGVTAGLPEQLCLQGLEMPWNGWSTGTPPAPATQWHLTLWPLPTCSLHPEVLLLERRWQPTGVGECLLRPWRLFPTHHLPEAASPRLPSCVSFSTSCLDVGTREVVAARAQKA